MIALPEDTVGNRRNLRKAAVVLAALGTEAATMVCSKLDELAVRTLAEEVARLDAIDTAEYRVILEQFYASCLKTERLGGLNMAQEILTNTLGDNSSNELMIHQGDGLDRLRQMADMDAHMIARRLSCEHPQTAAVLISQLSATKAAAVLQSLPDDRRGEILSRSASLQTLAPGTLQALAAGLDEMFIPQDGKPLQTPDNTLSFLLEMVSNLDRPTQQAVMEDLFERDEELALQLKENLFTFEDLLKLPDRALQTVLRAVDVRVLAMAMKGLDSTSRARVTDNLSERATQSLEEEIEALGPVRVADVETARGELANKARELEEAGDIALDYGSSSYIE